MFDAAVAGEIEGRLPRGLGSVEIAGVNQQFVPFGLGLGDDLAAGIDDQAAADQRKAVLDAGLGDGYNLVEFWYAPACTDSR